MPIELKDEEAEIRAIILELRDEWFTIDMFKRLPTAGNYQMEWDLFKGHRGQAKLRCSDCEEGCARVEQDPENIEDGLDVSQIKSDLCELYGSTSAANSCF
jgi:hypothetical protein